MFLIIFSLSRDPTGRARLLIILPASLLSKARQKVPASPCPSFDNSDAGRMISSRARPVGSLDSEKTMRGGEKSDER